MLLNPNKEGFKDESLRLQLQYSALIGNMSHLIPIPFPIPFPVPFLFPGLFTTLLPLAASLHDC